MVTGMPRVRLTNEGRKSQTAYVWGPILRIAHNRFSMSAKMHLVVCSGV